MYRLDLGSRIPLASNQLRGEEVIRHGLCIRRRSDRRDNVAFTYWGPLFGKHDVFFPVTKGEHVTPARPCREESLQRRRGLDRHTALPISPCLWDVMGIARIRV